MIDLHSHMLPGVDDGAPDLEAALAMARAAVQDGITEVCCTPHYIPQLYENDRRTVLDAVTALRRFLAENGMPLTLHAGCEIRLHASMPQALRQNKLLTLGDAGRYVLVELPPHALPLRLEDFFWELRRFGFTPVLAHPERHPFLGRHPGLLFKWVRAGALVQITAGSLLGHFGKQVREGTLRLLEHRLVHVIASDAHHAKERAPALSLALDEAAKRLGKDAARDLVLTVPRCILEGKICEVPEPVPREKRRPFWRRIFGRTT